MGFSVSDPNSPSLSRLASANGPGRCIAEASSPAENFGVETGFGAGKALGGVGLSRAAVASRRVDVQRKPFIFPGNTRRFPCSCEKSLLLLLLDAVSHGVEPTAAKFEMLQQFKCSPTSAYRLGNMHSAGTWMQCVV